jgi:hypothetical protein
MCAYVHDLTHTAPPKPKIAPFPLSHPQNYKIQPKTGAPPLPGGAHHAPPPQDPLPLFAGRFNVPALEHAAQVPPTVPPPPDAVRGGLKDVYVCVYIWGW